MKSKLLFAVIILFCLLPGGLKAQNRDKAVFVKPTPGYFQNTILRDDREVMAEEAALKDDRQFEVDLSSSLLPNKIDLYKTSQWHNPPISQGNTSTCWCFSTT